MPQYEQRIIDDLTGALTRRGFIRTAEQFFSDSGGGKRYALVLLDVVNFKSINEIFGHAAGDQLLVCLAGAMQADADRIVALGRLETDWFAFLVEQDRLNFAVFDRFLMQDWSYGNRTIQYFLRCGIYLIEDTGMSVSNMIERAVIAHHYAKNHLHRNYAVFSEDMRRDYISKAEILADFNRGLQEREFEVYFQPIIQAGSGVVVSAEALVRWNHKKLGFISPDQFIPVLEANGMITRLDRFVLKAVYDYLGTDAIKEHPLLSVTVNLSWQDFYDQSFMDELLLMAQKQSVEPRKVNFEVTETSLAGLTKDFGYLLQQLRNTGSKILLDDFGTGISSLGMIGNYPFDLVKIDRSFISQIESNPKIRSIIRSIVQMCHEIGLKTVGEGAETQAQIDYLKETRCDYIQGYFYAKPMSGDAFHRFFHEQGPTELSEVELARVAAVMAQPPLTEAFYRKLLDNVGVVVGVMNRKDYRSVYLNRMGRCMSGMTDDSYLGSKCYLSAGEIDSPCEHCVAAKMKPGQRMQVTVGQGEDISVVNCFLWEENG